ncbi:hypothetical protein PFLUV_G00090890 [Perca fluviatilis]|uniref:Protein DEK n=1 Tax=Perca fluviatilis TaxID=8168 RepID=A0A6A5F8Y6_PERFL|nr:hypothetical protein PFLUV_G00090890 [Perca fluviatilis]
MSEVAEEARYSSAVSEEEVEDPMETSQQDLASPKKSSAKISGEIIEGKRAKKTVERLDFQAPKQKEKLKTGDGSGDKLGDIPRIGFQINKIKAADLKPLHAILFDRQGKMALLKKNLRLFNGFPFDADSEQYTKKREKLLKNSNLTNSKLKVVCGVLDLEKKGTHADLVDRILNFLIEPKNSGKRLPVKKKRKSKRNCPATTPRPAPRRRANPNPEARPPVPRSPKPEASPKPSSWTPAAMMMTVRKMRRRRLQLRLRDRTQRTNHPRKKTGTTPTSQRSLLRKRRRRKEEEEEEEEDDDESPKSKSSRGKSASKKSAPVKRQKPPAKKTAPPKKRAKKEVSDASESDADSEAEEKPKKKKSTPAKRAAKTKKADSSSNRKNNTNTAEDSSDDDEPLIKMVKKAPTDEQLKETVQSLLKEANLEEMTMKQICQRVFDTYPDHDLASKKDYIKQTVKSLIT